MTHPIQALVLTVAVAIAGCTEPAERAAQAPTAEPAEARSPSPVHDPGIDLATLDICERVPASEVAAILGGRAGAGSAKPTMGSWATDCTYTFERDGNSVYAIIYAYSPDLWEPETDGEAVEISGLGDAAFTTTSTGTFHEVHVLVEGLYLDARADTPEQARALAELAVSRFSDGPQPR